MLHAYEEAVRLYELALAAFEGGTPAERCAVLLALGEAQARQGDDVRAKATFLCAADIARAAGESELLARATASYGGRFLWSHGLTDDRLVPLLEEGISVVGTADSALRVRLLSRLAAALRHGPTRARREVLMEEAIQMARRIGDPVTIASALTAAESALHAPHTVHARLANAGEIVELATIAGDRERLFDGHEHAFWASWEVSDPDRRARELAAMTRVANELRQPAQLWMLSAAHATLALAQGRFDEAPGLMRRAAEIGGPALAWNAGAARILQRFLLCCARGGLEAYLAEVRNDEPAFPSPLVHRSVLAHGYARLGRVAGGRAAGGRDHEPRPGGLARGRAVVREHQPARGDVRVAGRRRARGRPVRPADAVRRAHRGGRPGDGAGLDGASARHPRRRCSSATKPRRRTSRPPPRSTSAWAPGRGSRTRGANTLACRRGSATLVPPSSRVGPRPSTGSSAWNPLVAASA